MKTNCTVCPLVSVEIERDVTNAEQLGKVAKETFIRKRLVEKDHFFEPIKRTRLKTMGDNKKTVKITTNKNKVIEYRQQGNIMLQLLMRCQEGGKLEIDELMKYPLTPVPYSLGTANGFLTKTDKARGFHNITKDVDNAALPSPATTLIIEDGNAVFHYMREIPGNFKQTCQKVFDVMVKTSYVVFSTDMYHSNSVKAVERRRRGCGDRFIIQGEMTKRPADWKVFLTDDANKIQLTRLLLRVWSQDEFADQYKTRKVILISEGHAHCLESEDEQHTQVREIHPLYSRRNHRFEGGVVLQVCS